MVAKTQQVVGANAGRARSHNRQVVLGRVRDAGRIGRAEIARLSGLSTQAVSNIIADLIVDKMIVEHGRVVAGRGLPVAQYALNPKGGAALGFEIRPDAVIAALLDLGGTPLFSERREVLSADKASVMSLVKELKSKALGEARISANRLLGAGIVMPGPVGRTGIRDSGSELPGWQDTDPREWFRNALGLDVFVENDANAAAMAERVTGAARGLEDYAFIYFGTGLGLGIVSEGRLMTGAFGNAGEIGHIPVISPGGPTTLESRVSRLSAQRHLADAGVTARTIADLDVLYSAQHPALLAWLTQAAEALSTAVTTIENLFDPQAIILGGAMPNAILDHLIGATPLPDRSVSNRSDRAQPRLIRGSSGRMTATLGAAALVIDHVFTPKIAVAS